MESKRLKTGIVGFDGLIEGGFIVPSMVLVIGPPGSGKTTFLWQYLFEGIRHHEKGMLFSTLSESSSSLIQFASNYWFIDTTAFGKKVFVIDLNQQIKKFETGEEFLNEIDEKIKKFNIQRVAIDPINLIQLAIIDIKKYRTFIYDLSKYIKEKNISAVVTAELYTPNDYHCHEAYISDGTILLQTEQKGQKVQRSLTIVKMRGTFHELESIEYVITKNGIEIKLK
jgi:circadian clock protein KaiC